MDILKQMDDQLLESEDSENPPQNTSLDPRLYRKIIHGMQQQHLLEVTIVSDSYD